MSYATVLFMPKNKPQHLWFTIELKNLEQAVILKSLLKTHPDWPPYTYRVRYH